MFWRVCTGFATNAKADLLPVMPNPTGTSTLACSTDCLDMKDGLKLLDAIHAAYSHPEYLPKDGVTHCNQFVTEVCETLGFKDFTGLMANDICLAIAKHPQWSEEKSLERCQDLANGGTLVIATYQEDPHGHVNIICPGKIKTSGRWGLVPSCANVGKVNFIGKGINWAFSSMPRLWIWRQTL
jgi:hypothetical protein